MFLVWKEDYVTDLLVMALSLFYLFLLLLQDIWVCLRCGCCCCGPEKHNHVLNHFVTPRSDSHSLAVKIETLSVW